MGASTAAIVATLALPCVLLSYAVSQPLRWFSWHPLLMLLSYVAAAGAGILTKRKGGRLNTITHGYAMIVASLLALGGWYVIFEQKRMLSKSHNTSWHAWLGLVAIASYVAGAVGGSVALHPDFGMWRRDARFRHVHKLAARAGTISAFAAIGTGVLKLAGTVLTSAVVIALIGLGWRLHLADCLAWATPTQANSTTRSLQPV